MHRFSDFATDKILDGDKLRIDDILNEEIKIIGCAIKNSKYSKNDSGKYLTLQIESNSKKHVIFTGSDVLIDQVERYQNQIPFLATIRKIKNYYSFT